MTARASKRPRPRIKRKRMGRPPFTPTREQRTVVQVLMGCGVPQEEICQVVGVSIPTLLKHFRVELDAGMARTKAEAISRLMKHIRSRSPHVNLRATEFLLRTRFKWSENSQVEVNVTDTRESLQNKILAALAKSGAEEEALPRRPLALPYKGAEGTLADKIEAALAADDADEGRVIDVDEGERRVDTYLRNRR